MQPPEIEILRAQIQLQHNRGWSTRALERKLQRLIRATDTLRISTNAGDGRNSWNIELRPANARAFRSIGRSTIGCGCGTLLAHLQRHWPDAYVFID